MIRPCTSLAAALAIAVLLPMSASAGPATDEDKFAKAVAKFAPSFDALFLSEPFKPRTLCLCTEAPRKPGFLYSNADDTVFCGIPVFLPDGSFADVAFICNAFEILSK